MCVRLRASGATDLLPSFSLSLSLSLQAYLGLAAGAGVAMVTTTCVLPCVNRTMGTREVLIAFLFSHMVVGSLAAVGE